ncbi:MAG: spermidine/putrescine ABC transporter substrate-binding protein [Spirochaetales bacterium]|nr:spermidine/putrescine ABC transporter substrate-binding protein [Spirochaetales bacterium]
MKRILWFVLAAAVLLSLVSCGSKEPANEVNVFNWITYLPEDIRAEFTEETGIKLNYEEYDSNETMMAKLKAGARYDVAFPGGDFVPAMISEGMLQKIDHALIPNLSSIDPVVIKLSQAFDKGNEYSIPYNIGTTGIVYWKDKIPNPDRSYSILTRPELKGKIAIMDDVREVFGPALASLGYSGNSIYKDELSAATEVILKWKANALKFDNEQMATLFASKEIWVAMNYPENILAEVDPAIAEQAGFFLPKEGGIAYLDNMVILKNAKNAENAHKFINFILKPENLARICDEFGYPGISSKANALRTSKPFYSSDDLSNREIKMPLYENVALYTRPWEEVIKIGQ